MNFKNKTALVTGASMGIGRAVALKLAEFGAKLVLFDVNFEKLESVKKEIEVYTKDVAFKIKYSISTEMFKKSFTSAAGVQKLIAMIEANVDNTLKVELNGLARGILRAWLPPCSGGMGCGDIEGQQTNKYEYFQKLPCHKILLY